MFKDMPRESLYQFARRQVPCVGFNVRRATRLVTQYYDKILAPSGLRSTQYSLLNVLSLVNNLRMNDLALILAMDRTTLTRNLRPLIKQGLIKVSTGSDRRTRLILLTTKGRDVMIKATPYWERAQAHITNHLGASNWDKVMGELHQISMIAEDGL
ncbi:MAG TPA: MarR family winged helix-turn-helix transcriptional regulator [Anaerolineales bacterium]|nr:MarR family winged helix-turn-helix transcriptional regulator [Anaerolineales bacterium]